MYWGREASIFPRRGVIMRKGWIALLVVALTVGLAASAMADTNLSGFIRAKGYVSNYENYGAGYISPSVDPSTNSYVEQRARLMFTSAGENVKGVAFFEIDQMFGDSAYTTGRNLGGGLEADTINLETKNVYVWFKVPNTSLDFTVGVFGLSDSYAGTLLGLADVAGVAANYKYDPVTFRFAWAKFWENATNKADDVDFYMAEAKFSPVKDVKVGVNFYFLNDMGGGTKGNAHASAINPAEIAAVTGLRKVRVYIPGVDVAFKVGPVDLSGFFFYETGKAKGSGSNDVDIKGFAADLRADANVGPGKAFLEALYVSGDDNKSSGDKKYKSILTASNYNLAGSFYTRTDTAILLPNIDDLNSSKALSYDVANGGAGLFHVAAGYSQKLMDKLTGKVGVAYSAAAKKRARDYGGVFNFADEKAMATEVNANVNYNITKGLDFGLYGAYAWLGSAYDKNFAGTAAADNDNLYDLHARLNYAF